jgi:hypothetical protein
VTVFAVPPAGVIVGVHHGMADAPKPAAHAGRGSLQDNKENAKGKGAVPNNNPSSRDGKDRHSNPMPSSGTKTQAVKMPASTVDAIGNKKPTSVAVAAGTETAAGLAASARAREHDQSLWHDDDDDETNNDNNDTPNFRYEEVVRKKALREGLKPHDCPDCAAFVNWVMQKDGANVYKREELMCCSRHRRRDTPPSTPCDFWELSFVDERDARKLPNRGEGEEGSAGAPQQEADDTVED